MDTPERATFVASISKGKQGRNRALLRIYGSIQAIYNQPYTSKAEQAIMDVALYCLWRVVEPYGKTPGYNRGRDDQSMRVEAEVSRMGSRTRVR
jgi:hypothetical protein